MGDAAGIGPEVIMKALASTEVRAICNPLVIGDAERLRSRGPAGRAVGCRRCARRSPGGILATAMQCVDLKLVPADLPFGQMSAVAGEAAFRYIERAVRMVQAGGAQAICTAPLARKRFTRPATNIPATRNCWRAHRNARSLDDAGVAEAARHPRHHAYRPARCDRADRARRWSNA